MTFTLPQTPETPNIRMIAKYLDENGFGGGGTSTAWADITGTPTTLSGYGITDAYTMAASDGRYVMATDVYDKTASDARYLQLSGGTLSGDVVFSDNVTERFIKSSVNGGAIRIRGNVGATTDRGVWLGMVDNSDVWTPYIAVNDGLITTLDLSVTGDLSASGNAIIDGEVTAASATIGGYPVMRVRHSIMSGGIPTDMVEGEVWFGTVS